MPLVRKSSVTPPAAAPDATALTALVDGSDDERWAAARRAAALPGGPQALAAALPREGNARVREAIFTALAGISTPDAVDAILPLLRSDDAARRTGALDALRAMDRVVWPYVPRLIHDADVDVRLLACELARDMPGDEASRVLSELIDAELDPNVCASAVEVLAEVGGAEALPVLARCAERFREVPFLVFSIKIVADRIRSESAQPRA